jgi:aryl-alcohol dehydrogenase-like predicted oxidoreductase
MEDRRFRIPRPPFGYSVGERGGRCYRTRTRSLIGTPTTLSTFAEAPQMTDDRNLSRRDAIKLGVGAGALLTLNRLPAFALGTPGSQAGALIERAIPSTGEKLPVVGIGTAVIYQNPTPEQLPALRDTLRVFPELGGRVLDTAPSYGRAEEVVGSLLAELGNRDKYFLATKVSVRGGGDRAAAAAQMENSFKRLRTDRVDLMQIWNVSQPELLAPLLDEWKQARRIRYTGITSSFKNQYGDLEAAMKAYKYDFVQIDLAIDNRSAEDRIIPLAKDLGMAVLINGPFGRNRVFQKTAGKPLPDWAKEIDATSWAQIALKYIISNPAVTCAIPGTGSVKYATDNMGAARGRLPDAALRKTMAEYVDAL